MRTLKPLLLGTLLAIAIVAAFRLAGPLFFFEGRHAANLQALGGGGLGFLAGFLLARLCGGLAGATLAAIPGLLGLAAVTSHFGLAFPALDPRLDKGFGGLALWFHGFWLIGALTARDARDP